MPPQIILAAAAVVVRGAAISALRNRSRAAFSAARPSMDINLSGNFRQLERRLNSVQRKQLPFAFSKTLNDTAFQVRKTITGPTYNRAFDVKNSKFAGQSFRVFKSTKRKLEASVTQVKVRQLYRGNLKMHAEGGIRRPRAGHIAVPSDKMKAKRTRTGRMGQANRPRQLLEKPRTFIAVMSSGKRGIWQRRGKKRLPIELLYNFEKSVRINKNYMFFEDGSMVVRKKLQRNFSKAFDHAMKTRKR